MRRFHSQLLPAAIGVIFVIQTAGAADWPQWRGLNRDGTSPETGLLKAWPDDGPPLEMKIEGLGAGITSLAVVNDRIYTLSEINEQEFAMALDRKTGQRIWATPIGPTVKQSPLMRWLSQRTPTIDGERLYAITSLGQLACLDTSNGSLLWGKNYPNDYQANRPSWGFCDYPLVDGDRLICTPGGQAASVIALNRTTGEEIWRTVLPTHPRSAHSATLKGELDGLEFYVTFLHDGLYGLAADDGRLLWAHKNENWRTANSHTPLLFQDQLVITNGYGSGATLLKLSADQNDLTVEQIYFKKIPLDAFQDNTIPLSKDLYLVDFMAGPMALNLLTGEDLWERRRLWPGRGAMLLADGRLYRRCADGLLLLVELDKQGARVISQFGLPDTERQAGATAPVISDGRLYVRDNDRLFVYDIHEGHPPPGEPKLVSLPSLENPNPAREPRVPYPIYLPTPHDVVTRMLKEAGVGKETTLVDLGSGDGRIVIAAAKQLGARAIGYEIDKELIDLSRQAIAEQKLEKLARIEGSDMYQADLSDADVVAVFLYPAVLNKLKPQFEKMKAGTQIVSHQFPIPGSKPEKDLLVESEETGQQHRILLYKLPLQKAED